MNRKVFLFSRLLLIVMLVSCAGGNKSLYQRAVTGLNLIYNPLRGLTAGYEVITKGSVLQEVMGQEQSYETLIYHKFTLRAINVEKNYIQFEVWYDSLHVQAPMIPSLGEFKKLLFRSPLTLFTSRKGRGTRIEGMQELQPFPLSTNIRTQLKNLFPVFPPRSVKIGDTWTVQDTSLVRSGGLDITVFSVTTYRLAGVEPLRGHDCIKIVGESQMKLSGSGSQGGMEILYDGTGTGHQIAYFDPTRGILVQVDLEIHTDGLASLPSQGLDIATSTQQTTHTRLLRESQQKSDCQAPSDEKSPIRKALSIPKRRT